LKTDLEYFSANYENKFYHIHPIFLSLCTIIFQNKVWQNKLVF
jgi:hypothetical protein